MKRYSGSDSTFYQTIKPNDGKWVRYDEAHVIELERDALRAERDEWKAKYEDYHQKNGYLEWYTENVQKLVEVEAERDELLAKVKELEGTKDRWCSNCASAQINIVSVGGSVAHCPKWMVSFPLTHCCSEWSKP
jgi:hypothetical protein